MFDHSVAARGELYRFFAFHATVAAPLYANAIGRVPTNRLACRSNAVGSGRDVLVCYVQVTAYTRPYNRLGFCRDGSRKNSTENRNFCHTVSSGSRPARPGIPACTGKHYLYTFLVTYRYFWKTISRMKFHNTDYFLAKTRALRNVWFSNEFLSFKAEFSEPHSRDLRPNSDFTTVYRLTHSVVFLYTLHFQRIAIAFLT